MICEFDFFVFFFFSCPRGQFGLSSEPAKCNSLNGFYVQEFVGRKFFLMQTSATLGRFGIMNRHTTCYAKTRCTVFCHLQRLAWVFYTSTDCFRVDWNFKPMDQPMAYQRYTQKDKTGIRTSSKNENDFFLMTSRKVATSCRKRSAEKALPPVV